MWIVISFYPIDSAEVSMLRPSYLRHQPQDLSENLSNAKVLVWEYINLYRFAAV
jgi:hypothetical protein